MTGKTRALRMSTPMTSVVRPLLVLLLLVSPAFGQGDQSRSWPQKQVRVVVPFPAGGSADMLRRLGADNFSATWSQPAIVDNRAGAWFGLVAPPGTTVAIAQRVNADVAAVPKRPDVRIEVLGQGAEPQDQSTATTASIIKDEEARWRAVIKSANVTLE